MNKWIFNEHVVCRGSAITPLPEPSRSLDDWSIRFKHQFIWVLMECEYNPLWYNIGYYGGIPFVLECHWASDDENDWVRVLRLKFFLAAVTTYSAIGDISKIKFEFRKFEVITNADELADTAVPFHLLWRPTSRFSVNPYYENVDDYAPHCWTKEGF